MRPEECSAGEAGQPTAKDEEGRLRGLLERMCQHDQEALANLYEATHPPPRAARRSHRRDRRARVLLLVARSYAAMFHLKGAVSRVAEGATAFGNRQASHAITLDGVSRPGEEFCDRDTAWTRRLFVALGRFGEGVYVNFLGADEGPDRVREAYGGCVYDRLVDVKTTYGPDNVFHHNQNIRP